MSQAIFEEVIERCLSSAIPVLLEKANDYCIGKVFVYSKKTHRVLPMRGTNVLTPTAGNFPELLATDAAISLSITKRILLDRKIDPLCFSMEVDGNAELRSALFNYASLGAEDKKKGMLHIRADFGEVVELTSSLHLTDCADTMRVNPGNPLVKRVMEYGKSMFLLSTLYQAEHCKVDVKLCGKKEDKKQLKYTEGMRTL
jgi:hypothetical protein